MSDCQVVTIAADTAGEVGSRNADLAAALARMATTRRRRIDRIMEGRVAIAIDPDERAGEGAGE